VAANYVSQVGSQRIKYSVFFKNYVYLCHAKYTFAFIVFSTGFCRRR